MNNQSPHFALVKDIAKILSADTHTHRNGWHYFEIMPDVFITVSAVEYGADRGKLRWSAYYPATNGHRAEITTSTARGASAIAADLSRRLFPLAREFCRECRDEVRKEKERDAQLAQCLDQLAQVIPEAKKSFCGNNVGVSSLFRMRTSDLRRLEKSTFDITVNVRSWQCALMIALLVSEDIRAHNIAIS